MGAVKILIELPEELVKRAEAKGLTLDAPHVTAMIEAELARMQAAQFLRDAATRLEGSLTPEEIEAELAAAKTERIAQEQARPK